MLAGCSSDGSAAQPAARTVTNEFGTFEVPLGPQRQDTSPRHSQTILEEPRSGQRGSQVLRRGPGADLVDEDLQVVKLVQARHDDVVVDLGVTVH